MIPGSEPPRVGEPDEWYDGAKTHHHYIDGVCAWCGTPRDRAHSANCPLCPYDDGLAYLNEVDAP